MRLPHLTLALLAASCSTETKQPSVAEGDNTTLADPSVPTVALVPLVKGGITFEIPRVTFADQTSAEEKINKEIMWRLHLSKYDEKTRSFLAAENPDFTWHALQCDYDLNDKEIGMHFQGEYEYASGPGLADNYLYLNIATGETRPYDILPLTALLAVDRYWEFMDKYWLPGCEQRHAAGGCEKLFVPDEGPAEEGCSCDNVEFSVISHVIEYQVIFDGVVLAADPLLCIDCMKGQYTISIPLDTLALYMSEFGKETVYDKLFFVQSPLDKSEMIARYLKGGAPSFTFIRGTYGQYDSEVRLALDHTSVTDTGDVTGIAYGFAPVPLNVSGEFYGDSLIVKIDDDEGGHSLAFYARDENSELSVPIGSDRYLEGYVVEGGKRQPIRFITFKNASPNSFMSWRWEEEWR
jgi:hypothetical protein